MIPDLLTNPFLDANRDETGVTEEALVSVQTGIEQRPEFENSYQEFWLREKSDCYSGTRSKCTVLYFFPTSYLAERGFNAVACFFLSKETERRITERWKSTS